jgi:hypothetical protein
VPLLDKTHESLGVYLVTGPAVKKGCLGQNLTAARRIKVGTVEGGPRRLDDTGKHIGSRHPCQDRLEKRPLHQAHGVYGGSTTREFISHQARS